MKLLDGAELAGYIKVRQAQEVRSLRQAAHIVPKLAIIHVSTDPAGDDYLHLLQSYATDILVDVEGYEADQTRAIEQITSLNADPSVHGIVTRLPLADQPQTTAILNSIATSKDVGGLARTAEFDPPAATAINWLLAGYNINLPGKHIVIVGDGRSVGQPLAQMWQNSELDVTVIDKSAKDLAAVTQIADVLVCAADVSGLITANMVQPKAVIIDAGLAADASGLVGNAAPDVRELPDVTITPPQNGVDALVICALFDNVIRAARASNQKAAA